ncbi:MAG: ATP-dependent nuclease [Planctomycetota bacterium]
MPVARKDFTAIPVRDMNLLWLNRDTHYKKDEKPGLDPGTPRPISITVFGQKGPTEWNLGVALRYSSKEQVYVRLADENGSPVTETPEGAEALNVVHVPPFSGIGSEEPRYLPGYQNRFVGQGKPGDILRNLLLEVFEKDDKADWEALKQDVAELFACELLDPKFAPAVDSFILVEYRDLNSTSRKALDIPSAGSGFLQALVVLGFLYARPASILLMDEPDAHQHVILQRKVYDRLRQLARSRGCQLIVSTHSEVVLEDTEPRNVISLYGQPHHLEIDTERDQVREALRRTSASDILLAESGRDVLYVEDESSFKILREFAGILEHRAKAFFDDPFFHAIRGRNPRDAKAHLFGLRAVRPGAKGVLLLDGDNRGQPDHELAADGLTILRWRRYEIESYLMHPSALVRFVEEPGQELFAIAQKERAEKFLNEQLPPAALSDPLGDHDYLVSTAASKAFLPKFFNAAGMELAKRDYHLLAHEMHKDEIHPEVGEKLDAIADALLAD